MTSELWVLAAWCFSLLLYVIIGLALAVHIIESEESKEFGLKEEPGAERLMLIVMGIGWPVLIVLIALEIFDNKSEP